MDRFFGNGGTIRRRGRLSNLINAALREYLDGKALNFEDTLRRIIREELKSSAATVIAAILDESSAGLAMTVNAHFDGKVIIPDEP